MRYRNFINGGDIAWGCGYDYDMTFVLALVIRTFKILSRQYVITIRCRKMTCSHLAVILVGGYMCVMSWFDLNFTFTVAVLTLTPYRSCLDSKVWNVVI